MKKCKKKTKIHIFSVFCFIMMIGIVVWAQDEVVNTKTVETENGLTTTKTPCYWRQDENDPEKGVNEQELYGNIEVKTTGNTYTISNIPKGAKVKVMDGSIGQDNVLLEKVFDDHLGKIEGIFPSNIDAIYMEAYPKRNEDNDELWKDCQNAKKTLEFYRPEESIDVNMNGSILGDLNKLLNDQIIIDKTNFTKTGDAKKTHTLACNMDPSSTGNEAVFSDVSEKRINDYCNQQCQEVVKVTYGPPIRTYAGGGVEYEVTVTSSIECKIVKTKEITAPKPKKVCLPVPDCNSQYDNHNTQAGPTEEFDSCIVSCDNGKYSQNCINQCYKKVYGNSYEMLSLSYENSPTMMNNRAESKGNTRWIDPLGHYEKTDGKWNWIADDKSCRAKVTARAVCAGYYYYRHDYATNYINNLMGTKGVYHLGKWRSYVIDENGFLRGYWCDPNSSSCENTYHPCTAKCEWIVDESCGDEFYLTQAQADKAWEKEAGDYQNTIKQCSQEPPTYDVKTTKYTITVDNVTSKKQSVTFKDDKVTTTGSTNKKMVYNLPRAYIKHSNGSVEYGTKKNTTGYRDGGSKFYTSLLSRNTNTAWYDLKTEYLDTGVNNFAKFDKSKTTNNIHSTIRKFGYLEWNFDIDCFYALKRQGNCIEEEEECEEEDPNKPDYTQFIFRPISLNDVFPNGRNPRWNWSCSATNTQNKNYPVNPNKLTSDIQNKGQTIYDENSGELEYEFDLTREKMREIRKYNKDSGSYSDYPDMTCKKNSKGMMVCTSGFLNNYLNTSRSRLVGCNNLTNNGTVCDTSYSNTVVSECITYFNNKSYDILNNKKKEG